MNNKKPLLYRICRVVLGFIFKLYYNPKIIGSENIPKEGAIVVAGNHIHLYDQCLTILSTKRYLCYMAKKEYFDDKKVAWFFKANGCIPVDRSKKDPAAKERAIAILKEQGALGIFPEGTRNKTKELLQPFKYGAVSMAKKTDAIIVPFAITGEYKFRSKDLTVTFGKPFKVENMTIEEANEKLYNEVLKIIKKYKKK